jgi:hypothetical protein
MAVLMVTYCITGNVRISGLLEDFEGGGKKSKTINCFEKYFTVQFDSTMMSKES